MPDVRRRQVLLVDDEPLVLEGLANSLRKFRKLWSIERAGSVQEAIEMMERQPPDAVVSDAKMPERDGESLLLEVQKRWPNAIRVILTGEVKSETMERLSHLAHRVLGKPSSGDIVFTAVEAALSGSDALERADLRVLVCSFGPLPSLPGTFIQLRALQSREDATLEQAAVIVAASPSATACVLKVVNSAYFGLGRSIATLKEAVPLVGLRPLMALVLAAELFPRDVARAEALQRRAVERVELASAVLGVLGRSQWFSEVATAVVLCEVGALLCGQRLGLMEGVEARMACGASASDAEREIIGADIPSLGAALLRIWGLPEESARAVALHRNPTELNGQNWEFVVACLFELLDGPREAVTARLAEVFGAPIERIAAATERVGPR